MSIQCQAISHVGNIRKVNEDAVLSYPDAGLWAVADGMGGHQAGDFASQCIIEHLRKACDRYKGNYLVERLRHIIGEAHRAIYQHSLTLDGQPLIGTTIVILVLEADNFHCFWSGDSRCYLQRDRQFTLLTEDHTEAQYFLATGTELQHLSVAEKNLAENTLTHAIGIDDNEPYIDYCSGYIYEQDRFLLCSDGINKVHSDTRLEDYFLQEKDQNICQHIIDEGLKKDAPDNLSAIVVGI